MVVILMCCCGIACIVYFSSLINLSDEVREPFERSGANCPGEVARKTCAVGDVSMCEGGIGKLPGLVLLDINRIFNRCLFIRK